MTKFAIVENAKRQARMCFVGIAIPHQPSLANGEYGPIRSEKILKFNRTALRNMGKKKIEKADPRLVGGEDLMILKVGKPGSRERVEALAQQYTAIQANGEEVSPFYEG
jgi:tRNA G37 N-methylase TrmD